MQHSGLFALALLAAFLGACDLPSAPIATSPDAGPNPTRDVAIFDAAPFVADALENTDALAPDVNPIDVSVVDGHEGVVDVNTEAPMQSVSLSSTIDRVQPMTGIVLWEESWNPSAIKQSDALQLEYAYVPFDSIVVSRNTYDWSALDALLNRVAGREHQALIRIYMTYPGRPAAVPTYIEEETNYQQVSGIVEGMNTGFPDWSHPELERAYLSFYEAFAARYDNDARLAFLQVGFGLWGEYHIYQGPNEIGFQFPSKEFQRTFFTQLAEDFRELKVSISIDAGADYYSPFASSPELRALNIGNFDDSFMHEQHAGYNRDMWRVFEHQNRFARAPHGGELSYYSIFDQQNALNPQGIYGRTYESLSSDYNISYMIGNDQPSYHSIERIQEAGMSNGYRFRITAFSANQNRSAVSVTNEGIAPIYYDAFVAVNGVRSSRSLKGLLPGETIDISVAAGGETPTLTIECDRLVAGQSIQYLADL